MKNTAIKNEKIYQDIKILNNIIYKLNNEIELYSTEKTHLIVNHAELVEKMAENNLKACQIIAVRNKEINNLLKNLKKVNVELKDYELREIEESLSKHNTI